MYKRTKNNQDSRSVRNSEESSRVGQTDSWKKSKKLELDERNWIGSPMADTVAGRSSGGGADRSAAFSQTQQSQNPQYPPQAF